MKTLTLLGLLALVACSRELPLRRSLSPDPNPLGPSDPVWSKPAHRERPRAICVAASLGKAWVMNGGVEDDPGSSVAVVDLETESLRQKIDVGPSPWGCAVDPAERFLVVTLRYTNRALVFDTATDTKVAEIPVPYYTENVLWARTGRRIFFTNRWADSIFWVDVETDPTLQLSYSDRPLEPPYGIEVGDNPGPLALSSDGSRLFVGLVAGAALTVLDAKTGEYVDADRDPSTTSVGAPPGVSRVELGSPVGGLATAGNYLFVSDVGRGVGARASVGRDLDGDGRPGDGTANVMFQDLQNEIGVIDSASLKEVHRYTSDTICCGDFRDVDPDRPERGQLLPLPDTWPPEVVEALPPKDTWIVGGALPEAMVVVDGNLWVAYSGSNQVQSFRIGDEGQLTPREGPGALFRTSYNPKAMASYADRIITVDRLAEALTILRPAEGGSRSLVVGDLRDGPFPATDAEIGEGINEMTAAFTIDGDQTCVHCHRDNGAVARPVMMPLQRDLLWGARNVPAQRGLYDTRPWFFESAMDETNFFPVLNEFARKENFCCERSDPTVWTKYPSEDVCRRDSSVSGCEQVLHCEATPPPECAERPYARTPFLRRSAFVRDAAQRLFGRDTSVGDALYAEGPGGAREPIPLDFAGLTKAIGLFMLRTPRLLPNPNATLDPDTRERGRAVFESASTGCANCHPLPLSTTATRPVRFSPFGAPIRFPPVVSPSRAPSGSDASMVTPGFIGTFPSTIQGPAGLSFGATPLRGIWDRPSTRLLHDGRARSLREVLSTPGHEGLEAGEVGRNERDGVFDTHGGTSHLTKFEIEDLMFFLRTL